MRTTSPLHEPTLFHDAPSNGQPAGGRGPAGKGPAGGSFGSSAGPRGGCGLRRDQVLDRLLALRPGMSLGFLEGFSDGALREYLDRVESFASRKGRDARWVRPDRAPAIVTRPAASD